MLTCGAIFAFVGGYGFVQSLSSSDPVKALVTLACVAIGALLILAGIAHVRVASALKRLAAENRAARVARTDPARVAAAVPPGALTIEEHRVAEGTALGPPTPRGVSTLFLWAFDESQTVSLLRRLARVGPVYLLRGGGALIDDLLHAPRMVFGKIDRFIEESETEVLKRMATFRGRNRNFLRNYPTFSMTCGDGVWKFAFSCLLERAKVVVMDLSDFTPRHAGIEYELGAVLDHVPIARVVFVTGPQTDHAVFDAMVHRLWTTMPETSPNYSTDPATIHLAVTTTLDTSPHSDRERRLIPVQNSELDMVVGLVGEAMLHVPPELLAPPQALPSPRHSR